MGIQMKRHLQFLLIMIFTSNLFASRDLNDVEFAKILLLNGADSLIRNKEGKCFFDFIHINNKPEVRISELPIRVWTRNYKEQLEQ